MFLSIRVILRGKLRFYGRSKDGVGEVVLFWKRETGSNMWDDKVRVLNMSLECRTKVF